MSDTEKNTESCCIVNNRVGELGFFLGSYGASKIVDKRGALTPPDKIRFMPGLNLPEFSAVVGAQRRAVDQAELKHVLEHVDFKRLCDMGTITVYKNIGDISITEKIRIARNCSDTVVLRAWLEREASDKVKVEIAAQLAEIDDKGNDGDYRDVRGAVAEHSDHPGL